MARAPLPLFLVVAALLGACSSDRSKAATTAYLDDPAFRRAALVASLVNPDNEYSRLRLLHYDSGDQNDWSRLPEYDPRAEIVIAAELDGPNGVVAQAPLGKDARSLGFDPASLGDEEALIALGRDAFFRYPVQFQATAGHATRSRASFERFGFWVDQEHGAGGIVRVEVPDGTTMLAFSCATCHAAKRGGDLVVGVGNDALDLGLLAADAAPEAPPELAERWLSWGPGRVDVTTTGATEPVRIADLRPVRWLSHLHADATVKRRDRTSLAIRLETLLITSHQMTVRPPRAVVLALAAYVESLAASLPGERAHGESEARGKTLFDTTCAGCHGPPGLTGSPVPLEVIGTDPRLGRSLVRGTGTYRVPSLHGVASRGALLHDASLSSVAALLDPARLDASYGGGRRGVGAVRGHEFGLGLPAEDRAALVAYLGTL